MTKLYFYLQEHRKIHPALLTEFLLIYPAIPATYSMRAATYMTIAISLLLIATRVSTLISKKYFSTTFAYIFTILTTSTYSTLIFLITDALFPKHLRLLLLPYAFLAINSVINLKFGNSDRPVTIVSCFVDGILYFVQACFIISIIALLGTTRLYDSQNAFSILALAISFFILRFAKQAIEQTILSNTNKIIDKE